MEMVLENICKFSQIVLNVFHFRSSSKPLFFIWGEGASLLYLWRFRDSNSSLTLSNTTISLIDDHGAGCDGLQCPVLRWTEWLNLVLIQYVSLHSLPTLLHEFLPLLCL